MWESRYRLAEVDPAIVKLKGGKGNEKSQGWFQIEVLRKKDEVLLEKIWPKAKAESSSKKSGCLLEDKRGRIGIGVGPPHKSPRGRYVQKEALPGEKRACKYFTTKGDKLKTLRGMHREDTSSRGGGEFNGE